MGSAVFEHNGIVCNGVLLKEKVRLGLAEGASLPHPDQLFNAQLEGNKSPAIDVYPGDTLNEAALKALILAGVERNLAKVEPARKEEAGPVKLTWTGTLSTNTSARGFAGLSPVQEFDSVQQALRAGAARAILTSPTERGSRAISWTTRAWGKVIISL